MFTGIVEKTVRVIGFADGPMFRRLTLPLAWPEVKPGQSIAVNGVCLTIADAGNGEMQFDVIRETLSKTNLGLLNQGEDVHLERSLRAGDPIDGHFMQGHVDGTGPLIEQVASDREWRLAVRCPDHLVKYLVPKGSIAMDGVSLTIAAIRGSIFEVALIPTTLTITALGKRPIGWPFNLEADILSKTVVSYLERFRQSSADIINQSQEKP